MSDREAEPNAPAPKTAPPAEHLPSHRLRPIALVLGPAVGALSIAAARLDWSIWGLAPTAVAALGCIFWVALWWIAECMPIGATSLLPLVLLPAAGALSSEQTAATYMDRHIMLMVAGFMSALAIERWGLHRRMALRILLLVGTSPRRLVLGMLVGAAFASMWMSNTASSLIMLPIGLALIDRVRPQFSDTATYARFGGALLLAIAYGASLGGIGTPIGSPPNLIYLGAVERFFGHAAVPSFLGWMRVAVPVMVTMLAVSYLYLVHRLRLPKGLPGAGRAVLVDEQRALGPMTREEKAVAGVFGGMIVLWVTRQIDLGGGTVIGWSPLLGLDGMADDTTVAVLGTLALFAWPARGLPNAVSSPTERADVRDLAGAVAEAPADGEPTCAPPAEAAVTGGRLLDWETARRIPLEVVLLFGGGLALARACIQSGLSEVVADGLSGLSGLHPLLLMGAICLAVTVLTEVTSNTAITTLLMPILAPFAQASGLGPGQVMLPAAIKASLAFMLPVATPPNAVVFGSGRVTVSFMARNGFWMNLAGLIVVPVVLWLLV